MQQMTRGYIDEGYGESSIPYDDDHQNMMKNYGIDKLTENLLENRE